MYYVLKYSINKLHVIRIKADLKAKAKVFDKKEPDEVLCKKNEDKNRKQMEKGFCNTIRFFQVTPWKQQPTTMPALDMCGKVVASW